jgi:predicted nucleotidyltransferase
VNVDQIRDRWRDTILRIAEQHGVLNVRVFGSVARGESTQRSDVDLLVAMEPGRSYLDFVAFWQDVEEALECKVDVVDDGGISPYLRERILREAIPL